MGYKNTLLMVTGIFVLGACSEAPVQQKSVPVSQDKGRVEQDVLSYVDPFIGTGGHGHTFPGATMPFGMVQLSPDNPSKGWDWTSGYHYSDNVILGFSHTHLSGTGVGDLLDILVTPFRGTYPDDVGGKAQGITGDYTKNDALLFDTYSHDNEQASPGYYSVVMDNSKVKAEMTTTARVGVHRYTFEGDEPAQLLFNLGYAQNYDDAVDTYMEVKDDTTLVGYRYSTGWAKHQPVYFVAKFSQPFDHQFCQDRQCQRPGMGESVKGKRTETVLSFADKSQPIVVKVGLSYASIDGAGKNIELETTGFDFDLVHEFARKAWQDRLGKFAVKGGTDTDKIKFYTALYHSYIAPHLFEDANQEYYGADGNTHKAEDFERYTLFSLWDTFRTLHPLLTITEPALVDDLTRSMMAFYDEEGLLPSWDLMSNETDVMIGYHAVPVLVDAYFKGLTNIEPEKLFEALKKSAMQDRFGIDLFKKHGYIPSEMEYEAVSKVLEYAYDDWAIARLAKALNKDDEYQYFSKRANAYKTLFDKETGFMRGKDANGNWVTPFDPTYVEHRTSDYTEANAWQYTWFVPHDVNGLINLFGGEEPFIAKLDELFVTSSNMTGDVSPDISGLIGQYAHGNEPCHHIPYLYAFTSQRWKGEARIKEIREVMYRAQPDGLAGNDDVGQMSAWFVMSAMGFYPVNPADGNYVFGTPLFEHMTIELDSGKSIDIKVEGDINGFVKAIRFNGEKVQAHQISHDALIAGGELVFEMGELEN